MYVWTSAVCAAVGVLVVASTGAAPAVLVLKLVIVALNYFGHGGAKEEVLPVVVQLHYRPCPRQTCPRQRTTNRVG